MSYCSPISIQFIWHPDDQETVVPIVDYCKSNLSRDNRKSFVHALDFPIFCFTSNKADEVPAKINLMSQKSIAFFFVSDAIVSSDIWIKYLNSQRTLENVSFIPIALSNNAYNIKEIAMKNAIRYYYYKENYNDSNELLQRLFIAIAHEIYRKILNDGNDFKQLTLFLSHTKTDTNGLEFAKKLRAFINSDTNLDNFFDTNDIPYGNHFENEIQSNIEKSTLIIVHTESYSSRYWCQKEVIYAKRTFRPIISVDLIDKWEDRRSPVMCNYPSIRFNGSFLDVVELALVETIRFFYCKELMEAYKKYDYIPGNSAIFNSVPDGFIVNDSIEKTIIYPEPELYPEEKDIISNGKTLTTPLSCSLVNLTGVNIGISISDVSDEDLAVIGQDHKHLKYLSQVIAHKFLRNGAILLYGGDLRNDGFTMDLCEEALIVQDRTKNDNILIKNYLAWPIYLNPNYNYNSWIANYRMVYKVEKMLPSSDISDFFDRDVYIRIDNPSNNYAWSRSLTYMREKMISECDVRICAGGKSKGFCGSMPGLLEEIHIAVQKGKPVYLIGGFGGITGKVCKYLQEHNLAEELTREWQIANNETYEKLLLEYDDHKYSVDYSWIEKLSVSSLNNGLNEEENFRLFATPFIDEVVFLVSKGLRTLFSK